MKPRVIFSVIFISLLFSLSEVGADTIFLKNGRSLKGFVDKEDNKTVELSVDKGTVTFKKSDIQKIYKSTPEESEAIIKSWKKNEEHSKQEAERIERLPKDLALAQDQGHIVTEAIVNNNIKAVLFLDTGASLVVLTYDIGKKLGVDFNKIQKNVQMQVADGRKVEAYYIVLNSLSVQGVEAKNVAAVIMPEGIPGPGAKEGLLGMSFLKNFNFSVDYSREKLTLEKI